MARRHKAVSSLFLLLLSHQVARAEESARSDTRRLQSPQVDLYQSVALDFNQPRLPEGDDWLDQVTMRDYPEGSIRYEFRGFHKFIVRHIRSQYRRFVRQAVHRGWYVRDESNDDWPLFMSRAESDFNGGHTNGNWWQRSWIDSLSPEQGGAPYDQIVHYIGSDSEIELGPLVITNGLGIRLKNIQLFEVNPNPVETQGAKHAPRATIDIHASERSFRGTDFRFDVKPRVRIGAPQGGDWTSALRALSLRGQIEVHHRGKRIIEAEFEIKWDPEDGPSMTFDVSFVNW
jgi:hypothetical protein